MTPSLGHYIDGFWTKGKGPDIHSTDPATGEPFWTGPEALPDEVDAAVIAARKAAPAWADMDPKQRGDFLFAFAVGLKEEQTNLAELISRETGKPLWESRQEV